MMGNDYSLAPKSTKNKGSGKPTCMYIVHAMSESLTQNEKQTASCKVPIIICFVLLYKTNKKKYKLK